MSHSEAVLALCFSEDSELVASGCLNGQIKVLSPFSLPFPFPLSPSPPLSSRLPTRVPEVTEGREGVGREEWKVCA